MHQTSQEYRTSLRVAYFGGVALQTQFIFIDAQSPSEYASAPWDREVAKWTHVRRSDKLLVKTIPGFLAVHVIVDFSSGR